MSSLTPSTAALLDQGFALHKSGALEAAVNIYDGILKVDPSQPDALWLKGTALIQSGNAKKAIPHLEKTLENRPQDAAIWNDLGMVLEAAGEGPRAKEMFEKAVSFDPSLASVHVNLARIAIADGDPEAALRMADKAIVSQSHLLEAHNIKGNALKALGRSGEALAAYADALDLDASNAEVLCNTGILFNEEGQNDRARTAFERALESVEEGSRVWADVTMTLGLIQVLAGDLATALQTFDSILQTIPNHTATLVNRGELKQRQGNLNGSDEDYGKALALDPKNPTALYNRSRLYLQKRRFAEGWDNYEARWKTPSLKAPRRDRGLSPWDGTHYSGLKLLVWGEQGLGDQILFAEPLSDLTAAGVSVFVEIDARLKPLFKRSNPDLSVFGYDAVPKNIVEACGAQVLIGSLGRFLRRSSADFSRKKGYLTVDQHALSDLRMKYMDLAGGRMLVGVAWHSINPVFGAEKSIPLNQWGPILQNEDAVFVSLQYGNVESDVAAAKETLGVEVIIDAEIDPITDLDQAAAQIAAMNLVITIDNTATNIAGAIGQEAWVIIPKIPEWRWGLSGEDVPWYPTVRPFRQLEQNDWSGVLTSVAEALSEKVSNQR